jgi:tRNA-dihydrouridine synthase
MLDWTDRHCRHFHRQLTRQTRLYTEMVTTGALRLVTRRAIWTTAPRSIPWPCN